ncbi:MAG: DUF1998 domain-containing protein [Bacteroidota bacterium]|jgi:hypothetical protein|nr:DUF1998 domain-containing protein [Bacteroidota bacterium]
MSGNQSWHAGEVRLNQFIYTFGVGAVIDLPHLAALVMGLDDWDTNRLTTLNEERLLEKVRRILGPQVHRLVLPPMPDPESMQLPGANDWEDRRIGVPVTPFPQWMRCTACGLLASLQSGLFTFESHPFRADRLRYVHANCDRLNKPVAVPARFLVACERGHLQDFPWVAFVHDGGSCDKPSLRMLEFGVSGSTTDIMIACDSCGQKRSMARAFDPSYAKRFLTCKGRHPHLRITQPCDEKPNVILLGATNSWFPVTVNLLNLPKTTGDIEQLVEDKWDVLQQVTEMDNVKLLRMANVLVSFDAYSDEEIWQAIQSRKSAPETDEQEGTVKLPEWRLLSNPQTALESRDFRLEEVAVPDGFEPFIESVVLAHRLREVRALIGFTRLESPGDYGDAEDLPVVQRVPLCRQSAQFVPAAEVRGEGIFIRFREDTLLQWQERVPVIMREQAFLASHTQWRAARGIDPPPANFPGIRFIMIHSFAHALMRRIAIECGYSAAGIRERIYTEELPGGGQMAGVLLYTSAPDSEGTLGGLVHLGEPDQLGRLLRYALEDMKLCSSDPLCAAHDPAPDGSTLHGASCHACLFSPETSCERGNRYLDRSLLVPVFDRSECAFFMGGK